MIKVIFRGAFALLLALALCSPVAAQLANKDAPIIAGHYHLNASNIDAHMCASNRERQRGPTQTAGRCLRQANRNLTRHRDAHS